MVNIFFFVFVYFRGIFILKGGGRMGSGRRGGYHGAAALLLVCVYMRVKEVIHITQKELLGGAEKKIRILYSFSRLDVDFGVAGGKQRNDKF